MVTSWMRQLCAVVVGLMLATVPAALSAEEQQPQIPQEQQQPSQAQEKQLLSEKQLEQLVAPIALYPDSLLAQVLTASTYPLEAAMAARWSEKQPQLKGTALENEMQQQPWDTSVGPAGPGYDER